MRRLVVFAAVIMAIAALFVWRERPRQPYLFSFHDRAIVTPGLFRRLWPKTIPPPVQASHTAVSNQVLIVRDPAVVDYAAFSCPTPQTCGPWNFGGVIRRAFQVAKVPHSTTEATLVAQMQSTLNTEIDTAGGIFMSAWQGQTFDGAPVRLQAIVNRFDLAQIAPNTSCMAGGEVRFVYQALPAQGLSDYLRLIVEFELPCMAPKDFQIAVQSWMNLQNVSMDPGAHLYQDQLAGVIDTLTGESGGVRLRSSGSDTRTWEVDEFTFGANGIALHSLERQPNIVVGKCQDSKSNLGMFAAAQMQPIIDSNYSYENWPSPGNQPLVCTSGTNYCLPTIGGLTRQVLVLGSDVLTDQTREDTRFSLSVNTCTACHGVETRTPIFQIGARDHGAPSQLSGFLTGDPNCNVSDSPGLQYCTAPLSDTSQYPNPGGTCANISKQDHSFNDLLRRHLFLYTVQGLDPADIQSWKTQLPPFTAYQVD